MKEDTIHWPPELSQKPAESRFLFWRKDLSLVRQMAPTGACTCACQLNLPVPTVRPVPEAGRHTYAMSISLQRTKCFMFREHRTCASHLRHRHKSRQQAASSRIPQTRGPSVKPYAPLKTCNSCPGHTLGNLPTAGEPSMRALAWTELSSGIPDRNAAPTSNVSNLLQASPRLNSNPGCCWSVCSVRSNLRVQVSRDADTALWLQHITILLIGSYRFGAVTR